MKQTINLQETMYCGSRLYACNNQLYILNQNHKLELIDNEKIIYQYLQEWIEVTKNDFDKFDDFRSQFGLLERQTFGEIEERVKNPVAMQYDKVRNNLVMYSGEKDPEDLELAIKNFSEIK